LHAFVNDQERSIGTYLYGRRMYETMAYWEDPEGIAEQPPHIRDYAEIWQSAEKIVFSRALEEVSSAKTRIEREFDPDVIRRLKDEADRDISVGGPGLAAAAISAGLVDELHLFLTPIIVGGGNPALPRDVRVELELLDQRRFGSGVIHLHYRTRS
jgi:dihydrofolate reductase